MRERFDSVFRRNLVELDAPTNDEKRKSRKREFKWRNRAGKGHGPTVAEKLKKKNDKVKRANDDKASNSFLKNDLIMIWDSSKLIKVNKKYLFNFLAQIVYD